MLHALMHVFDQLLKLCIDYGFTMWPLIQETYVIAKAKELLNSLGCHDRNVNIVVNKQTSGPSHEVSQKVSMSGAKAWQFLPEPANKPNSKLAWGI